MSTNFTHKLLNAEIPPPESAWEKIAAELNKMESDQFAKKIADASIEPPSSVWNNVAATLNESKPAKRIQLNAPWLKWTAAAVVAGILIVSGINFFRVGNGNAGITSNQASTNNEDRSTPSANPNNNNLPSTSTPSSVSPSTKLADNSRGSDSRRNGTGVQKQQEPILRHASIESAGTEKTTAQPTESEPKVSNNVSSSAANYIPAPDYYFVTAPNGDRVRISSKFSDAVTTLYGENIDFNWKSRFDSWKSKLMSNPSFIPAAGNFLDIAELKDLLKEQ